MVNMDLLSYKGYFTLGGKKELLTLFYLGKSI